MPEGDTIFRAARRMHVALAGKVVTRFESVYPQLLRVDDEAPLTGRTIERVLATGKHLIIDFSGDLHLRTHMRMSGSWHLYRPGERWWRPQRDMRLVVATADILAVGFNIPIAEFQTGRQLERNEELRQIGPDLLGETFDAAEALRRMRARPEGEIADVLLNQRVLSGIGNVFKSEILHVGKVNPFRRVAALNDATLENLIAIALRLLRQNVMPDAVGRKTTRLLDPAEELWVYGRGGEPCRTCGARIRYRKQGPDARGTYWCAICQPMTDTTDSSIP